MSGSVAGAKIRTFFEPELRCFSASLRLVNIPVHSTTKSISNEFQLISSGLGTLKNKILFFPISILSECLTMF